MHPFKPWKILHLDLGGKIPNLYSKEGIGGFLVVFWKHTIPLGHRWISPRDLPMTSRDLLEHALAVIIPAAASHLVGHPIEKTSPKTDSHNLNMDFRILSRLKQPLNALERNLSFAADMSKNRSTSVVICTRDRPEKLRRCLESLKNMCDPPDELWVIDNAPCSNETQQVVANFIDVRYIHEPRPGLDIARNTGICHSSGEIIAFTDDDAIVHPDWLKRVQQAFRDARVMAVTGLVLPAELETEAQFLFETHWGFGRGYQTRLFGPGFFEHSKDRGVPAWEIGAGANMAFRRTVFDRVGLFDERLDVGAAGCSGDSEMWYRILAKRGYIYYDPTAVVYHHHRRDPEDLHRQIYHYMRGHAAALLVQFERYRHWGNIRRMALSLPRYYAGLTFDGLRSGFTGRKSTLKAELLGTLSGIRYYLYKGGKLKAQGKIGPVAF